MSQVESSGDARIQQLEDRLQSLEDELAVWRLVNSYGPAVDSGNSEAASGIWTEDGVYDIGSDTWSGRAAIAGMVEGEGHQGLIHEGAAHVMALPQVRLDGDTAVATGYSRVYRRVDDGFRVWRVAANRWELVRTAAGWRCVRRTTRLMDGSQEPRSLIGRGLEP
jgi:ketosteroid isomerase-like protein